MIQICGGEYDKERLLYFFYHMLKDRNKIDVDRASTSHLTDEYIINHQDLWHAISNKYEFINELLSKQIENLADQKV